jgi:hypothetical protein
LLATLLLNVWEGVVRGLLIAMADALALSACSSHSSGYARTDGVPVDPLHQQTMVEREWKEAAVVNAYMARNGYVKAQQ